MKQNKLRIIKDYEKLGDDIKEQIKLMYQDGYSEHLVEFKNSKGETVSALPFETETEIYLVKMSVRKALAIIEKDPDYDDDGMLRDDIREKYEDEYSDVEYMSDTENYDYPYEEEEEED